MAVITNVIMHGMWRQDKQFQAQESNKKYTKLEKNGTCSDTNGRSLRKSREQIKKMKPMDIFLVKKQTIQNKINQRK